MAFSPQEMAKIQKKQAEKQAQVEAGVGKLYPFWLAVGKEANITFLDGEIITLGDGVQIFNNPFYLQHTVKLGQKWLSFFCPKEDHGECPECENGGRGSYVCAFTIIDHSKYVSKQDSTKVYEHQRRLFIATAGTREELFLRAKKNNGLKFLNFDVARSKKDKAPRVGDVFTPNGKLTVKELKQMCGKDVNLEPANYNTDVELYTPDQLRDLGVGHYKSTVLAINQNSKEFSPTTEMNLSLNSDETELDW